MQQEVFLDDNESALVTTPQDDVPICLLHPGKTGGTYLKSVIRHNRAHWTRPIKLLPHRETISSTARSFGADRRLAFTFRDPADRFVSAFQSRLRQGRPTYNRVWSPAEATSFLYFDTPNELAEALDSTREKIKSAAYFAFKSIMHIKSDYRFHFDTLETLHDEAPRIVGCIDVAHMDARLPLILNQLGIEEFSIPGEPTRHASPEPPEPLSDRALNNLRSFWASEFEFFDAFKKIENARKD